LYLTDSVRAKFTFITDIVIATVGSPTFENPARPRYGGVSFVIGFVYDQVICALRIGSQKLFQGAVPCPA
jgi:hypothetical protein